MASVLEGNWSYCLNCMSHGSFHQGESFLGCISHGYGRLREDNANPETKVTAHPKKLNQMKEITTEGG